MAEAYYANEIYLHTRFIQTKALSLFIVEGKRFLIKRRDWTLKSFYCTLEM